MVPPGFLAGWLFALGVPLPDLHLPVYHNAAGVFFRVETAVAQEEDRVPLQAATVNWPTSRCNPWAELRRSSEAELSSLTETLTCWTLAASWVIASRI
jgi:hypothetical protein